MTRAPLCATCSSVCSSLNLVVLLLCTSELIDLNQLSCVGESVSPFIDEGDGLTSERERVRMLLSLAAHAGEYKMMVGAHKTI